MISGVAFQISSRVTKDVDSAFNQSCVVQSYSERHQILLAQTSQGSEYTRALWAH